MDIKRKGEIGGAILIAMVAVVMVIAAYLIGTIRIGGALDHRSKQVRDLTADILPPPAYLVEAYLEASLLVDDPSSLNARKEKLSQLEADFDQRSAYWRKSDLDVGLRSELENGAVADGRKFWIEVDQKLVPAIERGDIPAAKASRDSLAPLYSAQRAKIEALVEKSKWVVHDVDGTVDRTLAWTIPVLALFGIGIIALLVGSRWYLVNRALKPLAMTAETMGRMAAGDLDAGRITGHRTDEIGVMTSAIEVFREASKARAASEAAARAAQSAALAAKNRLRSIIETSTDIICTLDAEGNFVEVSENCATIMGWSRDALLGRRFVDFMLPEERAVSLEKYDIRTNGKLRHTIVNHHPRPDGTLVPISWSATWIEDDQITHCVGRDMTEHFALEARFQHAQRIEAIGQLTGGIAHDFNNLLTVIVGSSEALVEALTDPHQEELASVILHAAERAADLTSRMLTFARQQSLSPHSFDLNALLDNAEGLIRRTLGTNLDFSLERDPSLWAVFADPGQTETAILNLCLNARDAMPEGGTLVIRSENVCLGPEPQRNHPNALHEEYVVVRVSDSGLGMAPEVIAKMFEPFFTTKEVGRGTGLGLSMVYGFAAQSEGFVEVDSEVGKGTTVSVFLPRAKEPTKREGPAPPRQFAHRSETVLLVEDDDLVRTHVGKQLRSLGYIVIEAVNGPDALAIIKRREHIDLLFTDIMMPGGMNGGDLARKAKTMCPSLRILFTSGYPGDTDLGTSGHGDRAAILAKPYTKGMLAMKLHELLSPDESGDFDS